MTDHNHPPIITHKDHLLPSVFTPENLLREARRQKSIPEGSIPRVCILDPDGDIVQNLLISCEKLLVKVLRLFCWLPYVI